VSLLEVRGVSKIAYGVIAEASRVPIGRKTIHAFLKQRQPRTDYRSASLPAGCWYVGGPKTGASCRIPCRVDLPNVTGNRWKSRNASCNGCATWS